MKEKYIHHLIPDMIKKYRLDKNLTQEEFGKMLNISHAAVSDLERGITKSIPTILVEWLFCEGWKFVEPCIESPTEEYLSSNEENSTKLGGKE